jgi:3-deoxy-D-manno-octulosonate 8-phosphate phosphatase (KDO 8-P phosphatase)
VSIELIVLDVDGTLTDGKIVYSQSGEEMKAFDVKDGLGIASWVRMGRSAAIITGRKSAIVERRARELGIEYCFQGVSRKLDKLREIMEDMGISAESVAVIGDDWNDYAMLACAGISFAPSDAVSVVREFVSVPLRSAGGDGAVREMIDYLIEREGLEEEMRRLWLPA